MTSDKLSQLFSKCYDQFNSCAQTMVRKYGTTIEPNFLLSETYIHLDKIRHQIESEQDVLAYGKTYIKNTAAWNNSPAQLRHHPRKFHLPVVETAIPSEVDWVVDYQTIKQIEQRFIDQLNTYNKRLYNIYFKLGLQSGKQISEYLDISLSAAYLVRKECLKIEARFRQFIKHQAANYG